MENQKAVGTIHFLRAVGQLKETVQREIRTGWKLCGVSNVESVSDHMYMMAVMAMLLKDEPSLDYQKCVRMALVHDMAEALVGDITPFCGLSKEEKKQKEEVALLEMTSTLHRDMGIVEEAIPDGEEFRLLYREYDAQETAEAKAVKDLDRLEMVLQAWSYEEAQDTNLQDFFDSTEGKIAHPTVRTWDSALRTMRPTPTTARAVRHPLTPTPP